ncbi:MAG: glycerophosphodiester phosphodiesterase [Saprospiraceae bacterium]|nr:glycerophosphodiester phosphodiesterase [Saprospiraceae bacterium]
MNNNFIILIWVLMLGSCNETEDIQIDIQGHRGCRGLMPENTIAGFQKAMEIGVNTLEMDVVINAENEVIVSHEPFYHQDITTAEDGRYLTKEAAMSKNIYKMSMSEMNQYDVGLKPHPRFPLQKKIHAIKPKLKDVFETFSANNIRFNIEIKRQPSDDGIYHPDAEKFVDLVLNVVLKYGMKKRVTLQSFDIETLQILENKYPDIKTAFLTDDYFTTFDQHIEILGFVPDVYSPNYKLVTKPLINVCKKNGVEVIPWTVNRKDIMRKMIHLGVDGIITDYPDRLVGLLNH